MAHVARTRKAKQDLREIVQHIVLDYPTAAKQWVDGIESVFRLIASQPEIGECWKSLDGEQLRRYSFGRYIIYYRIQGQRVQMIRVLHGARDQGRLI